MDVSFLLTLSLVFKREGTQTDRGGTRTEGCRDTAGMAQVRHAERENRKGGEGFPTHTRRLRKKE